MRVCVCVALSCRKEAEHVARVQYRAEGTGLNLPQNFGRVFTHGRCVKFIVGWAHPKATIFMKIHQVPCWICGRVITSKESLVSWPRQSSVAMQQNTFHPSTCACFRKFYHTKIKRFETQVHMQDNRKEPTLRSVSHSLFFTARFCIST